jgi:hypothetical protein
MKPTITAPVLAAIITGLSTITGLNIGSSFNDATTAGAVIAAIVTLIRKALPSIDSHWVVGLSIGVGAVIYGASSFFVPIVVTPFASWPAGLSGAAWGAYCGALASGIIGTLKSFLPASVGLPTVRIEDIGGSDASSAAIDTDTSRARGL